MDYDTGRTRGTGFACFWNIEDADKVVEQSDLLRTLTSAPSDLQVHSIPIYLDFNRVLTSYL